MRKDRETAAYEVKQLPQLELALPEVPLDHSTYEIGHKLLTGANATCEGGCFNAQKPLQRTARPGVLVLWWPQLRPRSHPYLQT